MEELTHALTVPSGPGSLDRPRAIEEAGQAANVAAASGLFTDYRKRRAHNTLDRQDDDLHLFAAYLADASIIPYAAIEDATAAFGRSAAAWRGITWGLLAGFVRWLEIKGYAIGSINVRLTTVKVYAGLAKQAGCLSHEEYVSMMLIKGYKRNEGKHVDQARPISRIGSKKVDSIILTRDQANALKNKQPDTPQGRRDAVLCCLLLDHGLRVGELHMLTRRHINMSERIFKCERPKVDLVQVHNLSDDTYRHLKAYLKHEKPTGQLLKGSRKGEGALTEGMSVRAIKARVQYLGLVLGIPNLSPHDCRHTWGTFAATAGTDILSLQEAGGWASLEMPRRYVERNKRANAGVKLT